MKKILLLVFLVGLSGFAMAQSQEGTIDYLKTKQPAAIIELPYSTDVVENTLKDFFKKQGTKATESKGLLIFKNSKLSDTDTQLYDFYFKIDRKSRKDKDISVISLTTGHPGENIAVRLGDDKYGLSESGVFLNNLTPTLEAYSLELQIADQQDEIKKADKKYSSLVSDGEDLVKKKKALEDKIASNIKAQEDQRVYQEKQKGILDALQARRKQP